MVRGGKRETCRGQKNTTRSAAANPQTYAPPLSCRRRWRSGDLDADWRGVAEQGRHGVQSLLRRRSPARPFGSSGYRGARRGRSVMTSLSSSASAICKLNDAMRRVGPSCGRWMMTDGVLAEGPEFVLLAIRAVRALAAFTPDNDPYGEHDFGAFDLAGSACSGRSTIMTAIFAAVPKISPIRALRPAFSRSCWPLNIEACRFARFLKKPAKSAPFDIFCLSLSPKMRNYDKRNILDFRDGSIYLSCRSSSFHGITTVETYYPRHSRRPPATRAACRGRW